MHTYYALYVGSIPIPVGWFFKRYEAEIWAAEYYPHERKVEIRPFDFAWPANTADKRNRPSTFLVLPHRSPPPTRSSS